MTDIINEKWVHLFAGQCCADGCMNTESGRHIDVDHATTKHIVDIHNFIVEHGGLEKVKEIMDAAERQRDLLDVFERRAAIIDWRFPSD